MATASSKAQAQAAEEPTGEESVDKAAAGKAQTPQEHSAALEWLLSDEPDAEGEYEHTIEVNVGTADKERFIEWTIRPVDLDELRRIRRQATGSRAARRAGADGFDEVAGNLRVVIAGTVEPDLVAAAREQNTSPDFVLRARFSRKPGLLAQIAGEIMALSGYDDEDVREVKAAGN